MKRLGVDLGARNVGLSIHDDELVPARPLETIDLKVQPSTVAGLVVVITRERPDEIVIGLPLHLDGREGSGARNARKVAASLAKRVSVPIVLWDERLTTVQAQRARTAVGMKGRAGIDAEAAAILLQSYVDTRRGGSGWDPDAQ